MEASRRISSSPTDMIKHQLPSVPGKLKPDLDTISLMCSSLGMNRLVEYIG